MQGSPRPPATFVPRRVQNKPAANQPQTASLGRHPAPPPTRFGPKAVQGKVVAGPAGRRSPLRAPAPSLSAAKRVVQRMEEIPTSTGRVIDFTQIETRLTNMLPNTIVYWMNEAEKGYISGNVLYSDGAQIKKRQGTLNLESSQINRGYSQGFDVGFKQFRVTQGVRPSDAVRNFLRGVTVAECGGIVDAAIANAVLDCLGPDLFDQVFDTLVLGSSFWSKFCQSQPCNEQSLQVGDWINFEFEDKLPVRLTVEETKTGQSAQGWNLICVSGGGMKHYVGFGMSSNQLQHLTLDEVQEFIFGEILRGAKSSRVVALRKELVRANLKIMKATRLSVSKLMRYIKGRLK